MRRASWKRFGAAAMGMLVASCRMRYDLLPQPGDSYVIDGSGGGSVTDGSKAGGMGPGGAGSIDAGGDMAATGGSSDNDGESGVGADGPVAYFPFDEGQGVTARDLTANHNDATLVNFASSGWVTGKKAGALALDGTGAYLSVARSASIDRLAQKDAFTIAAWVSVRNRTPGFQCVLSIQFEQSGWETVGLYVNRARIAAEVNSDRPAHECFGSTDLPLNEWVHLADTFDGATLRAYVNGVEACTLVPDLLDVPVSLNPVLIGANQNGTVVGEFFDGVLDELVLYDRALTPEAISRLMTGALP